MQENNKNNTAENRKSIIKLIISGVLLLSIPLSIWVTKSYQELNDYGTKMISYDNHVNTILEMIQHKNMSQQEQQQLCLEFLAPIQENGADYNNCRLKITVGEHTYELTRNGNAAIGVIQDREFTTYPIYCERGDNTLLRILKNGTWYELRIENDQALEIDVQKFSEQINNIQWKCAAAGTMSNQLKPGGDTSVIWTYSENEEYAVGRYACGHLYELKTPEFTVEFTLINNAYIRTPEFEGQEIITIDDIAEIFKEEAAH